MSTTRHYAIGGGRVACSASSTYGLDVSRDLDRVTCPQCLAVAREDAREQTPDDPASEAVKVARDGADVAFRYARGVFAAGVGERGTLRGLRDAIRNLDAAREAAVSALFLARIRTGERVLREIEGTYRRNLDTALGLVGRIVEAVPESDSLGDLGRRIRAASALLDRWATGYALDRIAFRFRDESARGGSDSVRDVERAEEAVREDAGSIGYALTAVSQCEDLSGDVRRWAISARYAVEDAALLADRLCRAVVDGDED